MTKLLRKFHKSIIFYIIIFLTDSLGKKISNKKINKFGATLIRVMTFNLWNTGVNVDSGIQKIARHILTVDPDIVAVQEITTLSELIRLSDLMGRKWSAVWRNRTRPDTAILSKHLLTPAKLDPATEEHGSTKGTVTMMLGANANLTLNVWSLHLDSGNYGPYNACSQKSFKISVGESDSDGLRPGRSKNIETITSDSNFVSDLKRTDSHAPLIVMGDMNSPSHLDWIESTKNFHCGLAYEWPVSKTLTDKGLQDAFRVLYPDPSLNPGNTWSTTQKYMVIQDDMLPGATVTVPEPQDRIDFVYFKAKKLKPIRARLYWGSQQILFWPHHTYNDWPSDHASVVVDFLYYSF